jgi:hypothetical protein
MACARKTGFLPGKMPYLSQRAATGMVWAHGAQQQALKKRNPGATKSTRV